MIIKSNLRKMKNNKKHVFSRNYTQTPSKKNSITSLDIDDFWEDCFKTTCFPVHRQPTSINCNSKTNKVKDHKTLMQFFSRFPQLKSSFSSENRKKEAMENCCKMYERAKQSNRHKLRLIEEINNTRISNELSNCTWRPKINKNHSASRNKPQEVKKKLLLRAIEQEYNQLKQLNMKEDSEVSPPLSFRPQVNSNPNLKEVFHNGMNIYSQSNTAFFCRLERARFEEKERNELKDKGLSHSGRKILKSISNRLLPRKIKINGGYKSEKYKETIHNELFSLQLP